MGLWLLGAGILALVVAVIYAAVTSPTVCSCCNARWVEKGHQYCRACVEHGKPDTPAG